MGGARDAKAVMAAKQVTGLHWKTKLMQRHPSHIACDVSPYRFTITKSPFAGHEKHREV